MRPGHSSFAPAAGAAGSGAPEAEPMISYSHVTKVFGDAVALGPVDLDIRPGEFVSIIGPSGCGKSTMLRLGSGLDDITSGDIRVRPNASIGYVFQDATLMPWRSVRRNVELLGKLAKLDPQVLEAKVDQALSTVGLTEYQDLLPKQLSGGMKMRASLARSLVLEPDLFFFDEPFGALDEITRERLNNELLALFLDRKFASLFITHSVSESVFLSTRVLVMSKRPGKFVGEVTIPFEYPRKQEIRYTEEFGAIEGKIAGLLGDAHE